MDGIAALQRIRFLFNGSQKLPVLRHQFPSKEHLGRLQVRQALYKLQVRHISRRHCAQVLKAGLSCIVQGRALDGRHRLHAAADRRTHHVVHMAVVENVVRFPVISTQT